MSSLRSAVRKALVRSPLGFALAMMAEDYVWSVKLALRRFGTRSGSAHYDLALEESVSYIELRAPTC